MKPMYQPARDALLAVAVLALTACAMHPPRENAALRNLESDFQEFQPNSELSDRVPLPLANATRAVHAANAEGLSEAELSHRINLAMKRSALARAEAFGARARDQLDEVDDERTRLLLRASRLEVQQARREAERALLQSEAAQ